MDIYQRRKLDYVLRPVEKVNVFDYNTYTDNNYILDADGRRISQVSERYTVVQNNDLVRPFLNYFGEDNLASMKVFNGRKAYQFKFYTGREFNFNGDDIVKEQIVIGNSYDKTRSFSFLFGAFRTVCSNGLYTGQATLIYKKIHVGEIPVSLMIRQVLDTYKSNNFEFWKTLREKPLTQHQELDILGGWDAYEVDEKTPQDEGNYALNRRIRHQAEHLVLRPNNSDNQANGWGLFNQMNRAISIVLPKSAVNKHILGDQRAENYLKEVLNIN